VKIETSVAELKIAPNFKGGDPYFSQIFNVTIKISVNSTLVYFIYYSEIS
jgi:hypothetical protein